MDAVTAVSGSGPGLCLSARRGTGARREEWAIWLIGGFYLLTLIVGYGAAALVGPKAILAAPGKANSAAPLLALRARRVGPSGVISGIAFATILAVVAGLTITTSATFAHDLYKEVFKRGDPPRTGR